MQAMAMRNRTMANLDFVLFLTTMALLQSH